MVILAKNPVYSVLFLILVFINASFLLIFLGADFMALVLIVVYVGAIAVLFLFICMMLNVRIEQTTSTIYTYVPLSGLFCIILLYELSLIIYNGFVLMPMAGDYIVWVNLLQWTSNIVTIGQALYVQNAGAFIMSAYALLVAMVGAIKTTLHHRQDVKRQIVADQLARSEKKIKKKN